jgi:predicted secreted protein
MAADRPRVAFVAHCLLNQNAKTDGGAVCPGIVSPLVERLREAGYRLEQMPCPELAFTGINRFWAVKEQLDTLAYRRHCRRLAGVVAGAVEAHLARGAEVVLVGLEGSPSMGVRLTSFNEGWRGRPDAGDSYRLEPGRGIFVEELLDELRARGLPEPRATAFEHVLPGYEEERELQRIDGFLAEGVS